MPDEHKKTNADEYPVISDASTQALQTSAKRPIIAGGILLTVIIIILITGPVETGEALLRLWENDASFLSAVIFAAFYIAAPVVFIPAVVLAIGAGFIFGGVWGVAIALSCRPLGALLTFIVSRYIARDNVKHWVDEWKYFEVIDRLTIEKPLRVTTLMRLFPIIPFNLANYVFGLTGIDWKRYTLGTALGVAPGTLLYVYIGAAASDLTRAIAMEETPAFVDDYVFWGVGAAFLLLFLGVAIRQGKKQWQELIEEEALTQSSTPP